MTNIKMKSKKPIFSDMTVLEVSKYNPKKLKRVLDNIGTVLKAMEKNKIRIIPYGGNDDLDLDELENSKPNIKGKKVSVDCMFG